MHIIYFKSYTGLVKPCPKKSQFIGTTNEDGVALTDIQTIKIIIPISNTNYTGYLYVPSITQQGLYAIKVVDAKNQPVVKKEVSFNYIYWDNL